MENKKLTVMQSCLLFIIMSYSAIMRLVPRYAAQTAERAGWVSAIIGSLCLILIIFVIKVYMDKFSGISYHDAMCKIVGKPIGKILAFIYLLWFVVLLSLYCRYFGERLVSSVYATTDINIFVVILLVLTGIMLRTGINIIARMNKLIFPLIAGQLALIIILLISKVEIQKLTPVSTLDIVPIIKGSLAPVGVLVYLFFVFTLGDEIIADKGFSKNMLFVFCYIFIVNLLLVVTLIGTFGFNTLIRTPLPLLIAVKNISSEGQFSGLESVFISFWILADFITVTMFSYLIVHFIKSIFNLKDALPLLSAILPFVFVLSRFVSSEVFELQNFSTKIALQANVILGLLLPALLLGIAKIRKLI